MNCRHCARPLQHLFLDLGFAPPSNAYLPAEALCAPELYYPLKLFVCDGCWLVQTEDYARAGELFDNEYAYFSSVSRSWLEHAARYAETAMARFGLGRDSRVVEIGSNDGYLLRNFVAAGVPCLGIEPTASTAAAARAQGIPVVGEFFGAALAQRLAAEGQLADLIVANNVFAHVPDINDFALGLRLLLKPGGTVTLEFPHLARLIAEVQFDTVYHEHFSYLSLHTTRQILAAAGLRVFDVERLPTHGGSLRVYGCHADDPRMTEHRLQPVLAEEDALGLRSLQAYAAFQPQVDRLKDDFVSFLISQKRQGRSVAGYGAAAKGNTLINYAGVRHDLLQCIADAAPSKQGKYTPGSHIPIVEPAALKSLRPDLVIILPWNLFPELSSELAFVRDWGGRLARVLPAIEIT